MSDTPRTDRMVASWPLESFGEMTGLARQLERENAALREQLAERDGAGTEVRSDRRMTMDGTISKAMQDVIEERHRQVSAEGWTPEHDDAHDEMELAMAAAAYCEHAVNQDGNVPGFWPWLDRDWKPKDQRRDLVRAGALIIAELERLDRAAYPKED